MGVAYQKQRLGVKTKIGGCPG